MTLYFDRTTGALDPAIYSSAAIYAREMDSIFARSWLALGPADWLQQPGNFLTATMGELPVLAWCDERGSIRVFLNSCTAGMGTLTGAERGVAQELTCPCHRRAYAPQPSRSSLLPHAVPRVATFTGLVFACLDETAADLLDVLGDLAWYWQIIDRQAGGIEIPANAALSSLGNGNWKLPVDTYSGDTYRELTLLRQTRALTAEARVETGFQVSVGCGAMVVDTASSSTVKDDDPRAGLVPVMGSIFPNLSYDGRAGAFHIWQPRGPLAYAARTFCVVGRDMTPAEKAQRQRRCQHLYGPAGLESADHEAVWTSITQASMGPMARRVPLTLQAGTGDARRANLPGAIGPLDSEWNQCAFYEWWQAGLDRSMPVKSVRT